MKEQNRKQYVKILRKMSPEERLIQAFNISDLTMALFKHGLRKRFPDMSEEELHRLFLKRLEKCYNSNY